MQLIEQIERCIECKNHLPFAPNPVLQYAENAPIMLVGQAPGTKAHASCKPWNDASGERLREWLGVSNEQFYNSNLFAIVPMGFCYPGKGKSGDLPPRPECAKKWHQPIKNSLKNLRLTILVGQYSQKYYLRNNDSLTERCRNWHSYLPNYLVLPHPSPRNNIWLKKNQWFENQVLPEAKEMMKRTLEGI